MLMFLIGAMVGAGVAIMILGFLAVYAEDQEMHEKARLKREQDRQRMKEIQDQYREYY